MKRNTRNNSGNIDSRKLRDCINSVYSGPVDETDKGYKIRCPWHYPDNNPSCTIFYGTGLFFCWSCHGSLPKGKRGAGPYKGFTALGMDEKKARKLFLAGGDEMLSADLEPSHLPDLSTFSSATKVLPPSKVVSREPWPKWWAFRDVNCKTMRQQWFLDRFEPEKVHLVKERLPRLSLAIGGSERFKNKEHPDYLRSEVALRLSSAVKSKTINSPGLNLDPDVSRPVPASLFGLVNNRLSDGCQGVVLVEGPYDCMHVLQLVHGLGCFDVVALLGTPQWDNARRQLKLYIQAEMIKRDIPYILAFDHDKAGDKLTETARACMAEDFVPPHLIQTLDYPREVKDPGLLMLKDFSAGMEKLQHRLARRLFDPAPSWYKHDGKTL